MSTTTNYRSPSLSATIHIIIKYEIMNNKNKKQFNSKGSFIMEVVACVKQGS